MFPSGPIRTSTSTTPRFVPYPMDTPGRHSIQAMTPVTSVYSPLTVSQSTEHISNGPLSRQPTQVDLSPPSPSPFISNDITPDSSGVLQLTRLVHAVTTAGTSLGLDEGNTDAALGFANNDVTIAEKLVHCYMNVLAANQKLEALDKAVNHLTELLASVNEQTKLGWKLTSGQQDALRKLLRHFVLKPGRNYNKASIINECMNYISTHRARFQLEKFATDEVIKATIAQFLGEKINAIKSYWRKELFKLVRGRYPLDEMGKILAQRYEMQTKGINVDDALLAHVALQREIAEPLCDKPNAKGGDTGFWKKVNKKLKLLAREHGEDLQSAGWKTWQQKVIKADHEKYTGTDMTPVDLDEEPEQERDGSEVE